MKKELLFVFITVLVLMGCNTYQDKFSIGYGASDHDTGKNIHLIYGDTIKLISDPYHPEVKYECVGKYFHYHNGDSIVTQFIQCQTFLYGTIIGEHVCDCARDDMFLLADQQPLDSILGKYTHFYHKDGRPNYSRREYDTIGNYKKKMEMIEGSPIHQYWILNIKTADVWGPFSYEEYLDMKKQLGVPPTLMLKREKCLSGRND